MGQDGQTSNISVDRVTIDGDGEGELDSDTLPRGRVLASDLEPHEVREIVEVWSGDWYSFGELPGFDDLEQFEDEPGGVRRFYDDLALDMAHAKVARSVDGSTAPGAIVAANNRRTELRGADSSLTVSEWERIVAWFGWRCAYCYSPTFSLHLEHVIPVSKGGSTTSTNVVPACRSCNFRKGAMDPEDWLVSTGRLNSFLRRCIHGVTQ